MGAACSCGRPEDQIANRNNNNNDNLNNGDTSDDAEDDEAEYLRKNNNQIQQNQQRKNRVEGAQLNNNNRNGKNNKANKDGNIINNNNQQGGVGAAGAAIAGINNNNNPPPPPHLVPYVPQVLPLHLWPAGSQPMTTPPHFIPPRISPNAALEKIPVSQKMVGKIAMSTNCIPPRLFSLNQAAGTIGNENNNNTFKSNSTVTIPLNSFGSHKTSIGNGEGSNPVQASPLPAASSAVTENTNIHNNNNAHKGSTKNLDDDFQLVASTTTTNAATHHHQISQDMNPLSPLTLTVFENNPNNNNSLTTVFCRAFFQSALLSYCVGVARPNFSSKTSSSNTNTAGGENSNNSGSTRLGSLLPKEGFVYDTVCYDDKHNQISPTKTIAPSSFGAQEDYNRMIQIMHNILQREKKIRKRQQNNKQEIHEFDNNNNNKNNNIDDVDDPLHPQQQQQFNKENQIEGLHLRRRVFLYPAKIKSIGLFVRCSLLPNNNNINHNNNNPSSSSSSTDFVHAITDTVIDLSGELQSMKNAKNNQNTTKSSCPMEGACVTFSFGDHNQDSDNANSIFDSNNSSNLAGKKLMFSETTIPPDDDDDDDDSDNQKKKNNNFTDPKLLEAELNNKHDFISLLRSENSLPFEIGFATSRSNNNQQQKIEDDKRNIVSVTVTNEKCMRIILDLSSILYLNNNRNDLHNNNNNNSNGNDDDDNNNNNNNKTAGLVSSILVNFSWKMQYESCVNSMNYKTNSNPDHQPHHFTAVLPGTDSTGPAFGKYFIEGTRLLTALDVMETSYESRYGHFKNQQRQQQQQEDEEFEQQQHQDTFGTKGRGESDFLAAASTVLNRTNPASTSNDEKDDDDKNRAGGVMSTNLACGQVYVNIIRKP